MNQPSPSFALFPMTGTWASLCVCERTYKGVRECGGRGRCRRRGGGGRWDAAGTKQGNRKKPARIFFVVDRRDRIWYPVRCQAIGVGAPFGQSECIGIDDGI